MTRERARAMRKDFRARFARLAEQYRASQSDQYPPEYRQREGDRLLKELRVAEATLATEMQKWAYAQRVEAARLRHLDPMGDPAHESRRVSERLEIVALAEQYPGQTQAKNILIPRAREFLAAGNVDRARVYFEAARRVGVTDGHLEVAIEKALDFSVPHRRQAVEIEVMAQDEFELSRRDIAAARVDHRIGSPVEQIRASNALQMHDYKRKQEAPILAKELGIELPSAVD